ncbi:hypothetical protein L484_004095 [Morus notabilis]|uniref:Uncharacterized protein n=1 Tax=Morus notabilis TaxID=981085 RepID=W9QII1_9ROSA|nr:hypothetical protein L484_004095 [Morus notabilis]
MQSKISTFFKSSSSFAAIEWPEPSPITGEEDELDVWEKKQHQFSNTYSRRSRNPSSVEKDETENSQLAKKTVLDDHFSKPESSTLGRLVVKNKKRSDAQFHLELGQSDFLLHTCTKCGVKYTPGAKEDEKVGEVVKMMEVELGSGWIFHKLCKVFLFTLSQRVAGCLVAEPIEKAFKVLSISTEKSTDATNTKEVTVRPTTLQFGDFSFQRKVVEKAPSDINTKHSDKKISGAQFFVRRKQCLQSVVLEPFGKSFCLRFVLERPQLAFSQPTLAAKALASNYISAGSFLVLQVQQFKLN